MQLPPLIRFARVTVVSVGGLHDAGLCHEPTVRELVGLGTDNECLHHDLVADLNAEDDDGLCRSTLDDAVDPHRVVPGAMLLAGNGEARAVVRIAAVDPDGADPLAILPGPVAENRHLIGRVVA